MTTKRIRHRRQASNPQSGIYATTEDSWEHTIGPRLYAAGADLDEVFQVEVVRLGGFDQLTLPAT